jgi:hypothetical protein
VGTVYRNGPIHSLTDPHARALLVVDGRIAWLGADDEVPELTDVDEVVDVEGALIAPGFVDAHAHVLETGMALTGLDLGPGSGVVTLATALEAVGAVAAELRGAGGGVVLGHGWDESAWPESRPPTRFELDRAAQGLAVYLSRADLHSAVVSSALAASSGCTELPGWHDDGVVTSEAHTRAREVAREVSDSRREALCRAALQAAAGRGVVSVHEHSVPALDTRDGLRALMRLCQDADSGLPGVVGYRAELCETTRDARALLADLPGLAGIGGDLTVDGSIGSRSAALRTPYADADGRGDLFISAEQVANHVSAVTGAGVPAAFHVIGDRAMDELLLGLQVAGDVEGIEVIRAGHHRVEHGEMLDARALAHIVLFGLTMSVQPAFDATWGGPDGMYARRVGPVRAAGMNPFADLVAAGVPMAFGSDSPVTPIDPWAGVAAATRHHDRGQRIPAGIAFRAHTRGGWRAARREQTGAGELRVGAPASFAVWQTDLPPTATTQPPSGGQGGAHLHGDAVLPVLAEGAATPLCRRTVRDGVVIFAA